jgi:hypothetical protein
VAFEVLQPLLLLELGLYGFLPLECMPQGCASGERSSITQNKDYAHCVTVLQDVCQFLSQIAISRRGSEKVGVGQGIRNDTADPMKSTSEGPC